MKKIQLTKGQEAIIDDDDFERVSRHKWFAKLEYGKYWYASTKLNGSHVRMHRFILDCLESKKVVDHINSNGLDNRKSNLRLCTTEQNSANRRKLAKAASKFKGIHWDKRRKKWLAEIRPRGTRVHIGYFSDEIEAATAYNIAAIEHFGEFARLNEIPGQPA